jgi:maltooligosyltrehalose trehalohydrolase
VVDLPGPGARPARPVDRAGHRFVVYLQDHDQVGNRATGDRISATLSDGLLKVGAALVLTSPYTPMLWMGEEWGARTPWQFFSDHEGDLGEAVRQGRRAEFGSHGWDTEDVPDPQSEQTLRDSTLDWSEPEQERHAALLAWHRDLIALRRSRLELSDGRRDRVEVRFDEDARWLLVRRGGVLVAANLGQQPAVVPLPGAGRVLLASEPAVAVDGPSAQLPAESVVVLELQAEPLGPPHLEAPGPTAPEVAGGRAPGRSRARVVG